MTVAHGASEYLVYLATNTVSGNRYVGVTGKSLATRISGHASYAKGRGTGPFQMAIKKHGTEAFEFSVLSRWATREAAIAAEIAAIAELKPEYNATLGGDGQVGRVMSEESRKRIGQSKIGNLYNLGKRRSEKTRARLREVGMSQLGSWLARSHLGPEASAKSVVCLDDGLVYPSVSAAARHYGVDIGALSQLCGGKRGRKTLGKKHFAYAEAAHGSR